MTTKQLINQFVSNHQSAAEYICSLPDEDFERSANEKWSAGQQLAHLLLCIRPISQALSSPDYIREKFGLQTREAMDYDAVMAAYRTGLQNGGKAPERFVPPMVTISERETLHSELNEVLATIQQQLNTYSESDLDTLVLPHPFLGLLSIRELFYLMSYHPLHHLQQVKKHLAATVGKDFVE